MASGFQRFTAFTRHKPAQSKTIVQLPNYKPLPLRWTFLVSLFLILCLFTALLEYARHVLPVTRYAKDIPQLSPQASSENSGILSYSDTVTVSRRTLHVSLATTAFTRSRPTGSRRTPWEVNNSTTRTSINNTSIAGNGSVPQIPSSTISSENRTTLTGPKNLYPQPSDYAVYNPGYSPTIRLTSRCVGEPGPPGQSLVWNDPTPDDYFYFDLCPGNPQPCWVSQVVWHSNDPNDCLATFVWNDFDEPPLCKHMSNNWFSLCSWELEAYEKQSTILLVFFKNTNSLVRDGRKSKRPKGLTMATILGRYK
jgi:hypothetical protein